MAWKRWDSITSTSTEKTAVDKNGHNKPSVYSVKPITCPAADRHAVLTWEQKNGTVLPEDLKQFYLTNDGVHVTWSVKMGNGPFQLGKLWLNPVSQLTRIVGGPGGSSLLPSLADLEDSDDEVESISGGEKPRFDSTCKIFELDPCDGFGKVCLVYKGCKAGRLDPKPEVWFLDRALRWHYLSPSFTAYYRLMLMHLGLPQWQYAFTDIGLSTQAKQWFQLFAPLRLELDLDTQQPQDPDLDPQPSPSTLLTQIDASRLFKAKSDKKKQSNSAPVGQAQKKKAPLPGSKTPTGKHGGSSTQSSVKSQR